VPPLSHSSFEMTMHGAYYVKEHPFFASPIEVSARSNRLEKVLCAL
jgi:hypothetical protein